MRRDRADALQHRFGLPDFEVGETGGAGDGVAGVGGAVEEHPRAFLRPERFVDPARRQGRAHRQKAASDALRQAQHVGRHTRLLAGEQGAGPPEAGHYLVGDEKDVVAPAQGGQFAKNRRRVHQHAGRAQHQRLDDQRRDLVARLAEQGPERFDRPLPFPGAGNGRKSTWKSIGWYGEVKTPRAPTDIAPKVSP